MSEHENGLNDTAAYEARHYINLLETTYRYSASIMVEAGGFTDITGPSTAMEEIEPSLREEYLKLIDPHHKNYILGKPGYAGFFTYTMFTGRKEGRRKISLAEQIG